MSKKLNRQIDLCVSGLHVREAQGEERSRTIEGHAVVFGVRSVNLVPWSSYREIYEIMEPGCITQELLNRSDVVLTAFHNDEIILGRWRQGNGTLKLELDRRGLRIECTLAETATADELLSSIERGDISGMSFAFVADEEDSENGVSYEKTTETTSDGKVVWLRHVKKVTELYDVTIAEHPAYPQTDIAQREAADRFFDKHCKKEETQEERERKEEDEREAARIAERERREQAERQRRHRQHRRYMSEREFENTTY
ncbi:MAG: HK97 family phage prohead protease [Prevotella sp.]|nr:HK97 family phage prohead protease [Prevotella sp.]